VDENNSLLVDIFPTKIPRQENFPTGQDLGGEQLPPAPTTSPLIDVHTTVARGMPEDGRFPLNDIPTPT